MPAQSGNDLSISQIRDGLINPGFTSPLYVSATSFTVSGDVTSWLRPGRGVVISFATSGIKRCVATSLSFSSSTNKTTINTIGDSLVNETITSVLLSSSDLEPLANKKYLGSQLDLTCKLYLPLDEGLGTTTKDLSGWSNHGTLVNGPTWTTGRVGNCLSFDGANDYVNCGNNTILCPANGQITIEFWMNPSIDLTSGTSNRYMVSYSWGWTEIFYSDGKLYWEVYDESHNKYSKTLSYTFPKNTWYHIAAVSTGYNSPMYLYINGNQNNLGNSPSSYYGLVYENLYLGKSGSYYWSGLIDEVRVYNRALSASEIQDHYLNP